MLQYSKVVWCVWFDLSRHVAVMQRSTYSALLSRSRSSPHMQPLTKHLDSSNCPHETGNVDRMQVPARTI